MKSLILILLAASIAIAAQPAAAKTTRHCRAHWEIRFLNVNGNVIQHGPHQEFGAFDAEGSCGNTVPNRCRERARVKARACMAATWQRPNPPECNDRALRGRSGEFRRAVGDLGGAILWNACCTRGGDTSRSTVVVSVKGITNGDKGCPGSQTFQSERTVSCALAHERFGKACGRE